MSLSNYHLEELALNFRKEGGGISMVYWCPLAGGAGIIWGKFLHFIWIQMAQGSVRLIDVIMVMFLTVAIGLSAFIISTKSDKAFTGYNQLPKRYRISLIIFAAVVLFIICEFVLLSLIVDVLSDPNAMWLEKLFIYINMAALFIVIGIPVLFGYFAGSMGFIMAVKMILYSKYTYDLPFYSRDRRGFEILVGIPLTLIWVLFVLGMAGLESVPPIPHFYFWLIGAFLLSLILIGIFISIRIKSLAKKEIDAINEKQESDPQYQSERKGLLLDILYG